MNIYTTFNHSSSISLNPKTLSFCPQLFSVSRKTTTIITVTAKSSTNRNTGDGDGNSSVDDVRGSGTTARGRRLLKVREEKRKREYDRLHNYPSWAK